MGFSSFSEHAKRIIEAVKNNVDDDDAREVIYKEFVDIFGDMDFDNLEEIEGIDRVMDKIIADLNEASDDVEMDEEADEEDDWEDDEEVDEDFDDDYQDDDEDY